MIELAWTIILGLVAGILTGLIPGIPIFLGFLLFLPFVPLDPLLILIYAIVMSVGTQFFGSIAVFYLKIPGESSSYPVLFESRNFTTPEDIYKAVRLTTLGSLIATVIAGLGLYVALSTNIFSKSYMPILVKLLLFIFLMVFAVFSSKRYLLNFITLIFCSIFVFYPEISSNSKGALPIFYFNNNLALIIIIAMQLVWDRVNYFEKTVDVMTVSQKQKFSDVTKKIPLMIKYSLIGSLFGFIPQLGATISSYASYAWEKFKKKDSYDRITASETANNSAIISNWFPLLLFSVPISATDIILLQHLNRFGFNFNFLQSPVAQIQILLSVIFAGIIYYLISILVNQKFYTILAKVISKKWFIISLAAISISIFYFLENYNLQFLIIHIIIFVPISWLIYRLKIDTLSFTVGLLLMKTILFTIYQCIQIYF
jgi:putative tricarboxylic transport membrane protein